MPILTRITRLFHADLHGLLDRIEEPELQLAQSIREMQQALAEDIAALEARRRERAALQRRREEIAATLSRVTSELSTCLDAGNDDLARVLLRRRLEGERLDTQLQRAAARLDADIEPRQQSLQVRRRRLEQLQQQAEAHAAQASEAVPAAHWSADEVSVSDADVEIALLRERRSQS